MIEQPERIRTIRSWILKAESDFKTAEHTLTMPPDVCPFDTVCYHAQQLVEKYLKALLVAEDIDFPKTHDIGNIVDLLPSSIVLPLNVVERDTLTEYAIGGRYPSDSNIMTAAEAGEAMAIARRVREAVRKHLPPEALH